LRRILLADDNVDFATHLGQLLVSRGHEVRIVHDGAQALEAAAQFEPDIAFVDIGMPKVQGYEVARRLRAQPATAGCVLVALTGWGQEDDRHRAREAGFDHHLVKPVKPGEIEAILESYGGAPGISVGGV
jgi:two-component system, sensor histidine kinase